MAILNEKILENSECVRVQIDQLELYLRMRKGIIAAAASWKNNLFREKNIKSVKVPNLPEWKNEAFIPHDGLFISESLAIDPYIINLEEPFMIRAFDSISGSVNLPSVIKVFDGDGRNVHIVPTFPHKDAWFGDSHEGIPGISVNSSFIFGFSSINDFFEEYVKEKNYKGIICPIIIRNETNSSYDVSRLYAPTEELSLYTADNALFCDQLIISVREDSVGIDVRPGISNSLPASKQIEKARTPAEVRFFKRSLSMFLKLTGR